MVLYTDAHKNSKPENIDFYGYDPFIALEVGYVARLNTSVDPNPPAGFELDDEYQKWLHSEADKFSRGESSVVYRRDANVIWLPSRSHGHASDFITEFFGSRTKAPICITALPNERGKGKPVTIYTRDASEIEAFVKANDKAGWAIYFCVNPVVEGKKRNKENMAAIVVLHADLDHKGIIEKHDAILEALKKLPMQPSLIVLSGHGIHCYWFLQKPMPVGDRDRVEGCLKQIARVLAGDPAVCEIARIMRLPGTHNTKGGEWLDVHVVGERGPDYSFDDLERWFSDADPVLTRVKPVEKEQKAGNGHDPDAEDYDPWERYGIDFKEPIDPDVELGLMQYHDSAGHGVDLTQFRCIGHYVHYTEMLIDEAVNYVVNKTFEIIPEAASWSRSEEVRKVRKMAVRTYVKHPELLDKQSQLPKWLENDARIKKLRVAPPVELKQEAKPTESKTTSKPVIEPLDLWKKREPPLLPKGLLPKVIEDYAFNHAEMMGCDPAGLAMSALTVCAAAISDNVKLKVKKHDTWTEAARLWVALAGPVSAIKSPQMRRAAKPLTKIDAELSRAYEAAKAAYEEMDKEEKKTTGKPRHKRVRLEDTTPEAAQPILRDSPDGVLLILDEMSGFLCAMDKYSGGRGAGADRAFWLQTYNGVEYTWDRSGRGSGFIPNLSVNLLGGIQEDLLRKMVSDGHDDGLIERMNIVMLRSAVSGKDEPRPPDHYEDLIKKLRLVTPKDFLLSSSYEAVAAQHSAAPEHSIEFDDAAQVIRQEQEDLHIELSVAYEKINKVLAGHIGKFKGMFARLCLLFHCIENIDASTEYISAETARRVAKFMNEYLLQHAVAFYIGTMGLSDDHERLIDIAGYILAHKLDHLTTREIARGSHGMRALEKRETDRLFEQLEAYGWIIREQGRRYFDVVWKVNPEAHRLFAAKAEEEKKHRERQRALIIDSIPKGKAD
jgi:hypothetical protein